jgi:hypothetical protein
MPGSGAGGGRPRKSAEEKFTDGVMRAVEEFEAAQRTERRRRQAE